MAKLPSVVILPAQVVVVLVAGIIAIPSGLQTSAKLLKLKSMARQNRKYWDRLKTFLIKRISLSISFREKLMNRRDEH